MSKPGEESSPYAKFHTYRRGWTDGAAGSAMDPKHGCPPKTRNDHNVQLRPEFIALYERGYTEGVASRREHLAKIADEFGYAPSILRTDGVKTGRMDCSQPNISSGPHSDS